MIKDELTEAVEQCIQAAGAEFEPSLQKGLLRVNIYQFGQISFFLFVHSFFNSFTRSFVCISVFT